jgi:hypothetical protein
MVRRPPLLTWVLALLLSMQWGLAASHCLARLAACHQPAAPHHHAGTGGGEPHGPGQHAGPDHRVAHQAAEAGHHGARHAAAGDEAAEDDTGPTPLAARPESCPVSPAPVMPAAEAPAMPGLRVAYRLAPDLASSPAVLPPARAPPQQPRAPPIA